MNYITRGDTIIFASSFNNELDYMLLNNYKKIIFSDYDLNDDLFEKYENNDFRGLEFISSTFNQSINNLPCSITH